MIMQKFSLVALCVLGVLCLSSCYAFLRADKMMYYGNIMRPPQQVFVDSIFQSGVFEPDTTHLIKVQ